MAHTTIFTGSSKVMLVVDRRLASDQVSVELLENFNTTFQTDFQQTAVTYILTEHSHRYDHIKDDNCTTYGVLLYTVWEHTGANC